MKGFLQSVSIAAIILFGGAIAAYSQTPVIAPGGVLNGASFDKTGQPVTPGSLISIFGTNLAAATASADSIPLSTTLSSVSVTFNGIQAAMKDVVHSDANGDQINAQVPWEILPLLPPGTTGTIQVPVVVTRNGVASAPVNVAIGPTAPGFFTFQFGVGQAVAAIASDGAIAAPANSGLPFTSHPAKAGDVITTYATGLGAVDSTVKDGDVPTTITSAGLTTPTVLVGGIPATVAFSGLVGRDAAGKALGFVGVFQINFTVPQGVAPGNSVPVQLRMNGFTSTNQVTIAVSQ